MSENKNDGHFRIYVYGGGGLCFDFHLTNLQFFSIAYNAASEFRLRHLKISLPAVTLAVCSSDSSGLLQPFGVKLCTIIIDEQHPPARTLSVGCRYFFIKYAKIIFSMLVVFFKAFPSEIEVVKNYMANSRDWHLRHSIEIIIIMVQFVVKQEIYVYRINSALIIRCM